MRKTGKMSFCDVSQEFHENGCGAMWRSLCGAIQNGKKYQKRKT